MAFSAGRCGERASCAAAFDDTATTPASAHMRKRNVIPPENSEILAMSFVSCTSEDLERVEVFRVTLPVQLIAEGRQQLGDGVRHLLYEQHHGES